MKKVLSIMLIVLVFGGFSFTGEDFERSPANIELNGVKVESEGANPFIVEGTTMVPTRWIADNFDKNIQWSSELKAVLINSSKLNWEGKIPHEEKTWRGYPRFNLIIDNRLTYPISNNVPGIVIEGASYVPLRHLANNLYLNIEWDNDEKKLF